MFILFSKFSFKIKFSVNVFSSSKAIEYCLLNFHFQSSNIKETYCQGLKVKFFGFSKTSSIISEVKYFLSKSFASLKVKVKFHSFSTFMTFTGHIASAISISVSFPT